MPVYTNEVPDNTSGQLDWRSWGWADGGCPKVVPTTTTTTRSAVRDGERMGRDERTTSVPYLAPTIFGDVAGSPIHDIMDASGVLTGRI